MRQMFKLTAKATAHIFINTTSPKISAIQIFLKDSTA